MSEETTTTQAAPAAPAIPPDVAERLQKIDAIEKMNRDVLSENKKLKEKLSAQAGEVAKTAEQLQEELRREREEKKQKSAENDVLAAFNAEGIRLPETLRKSYLSAVLNAPGVELTDEGVKGVGDALKVLREAGLFGGIPESPKPESSPSMAKPKANASAPDPKFAKVESLPDLMRLGVEAFNEFRDKYPDRFAALGRKK